MKRETGLRPGERFFALILLAFALYAFRESYGISGFSGLTTGGVMPMLASGVLIVSGGFILADTLRRKRSEPQGLTEVAAYLFSLRVILFTALLLAYAAAIPWAGFLGASAVFLFVSIMLLWRNGILWSLAISTVSMTAIYVLFRVVFQVVLPFGSFWQ